MAQQGAQQATAKHADEVIAAEQSAAQMDVVPAS